MIESNSHIDHAWFQFCTALDEYDENLRVNNLMGDVSWSSDPLWWHNPCTIYKKYLNGDLTLKRQPLTHATLARKLLITACIYAIIREQGHDAALLWKLSFDGR